MPAQGAGGEGSVGPSLPGGIVPKENGMRDAFASSARVTDSQLCWLVLLMMVTSDFRSLSELEQRLLSFQEHYQQVARPFQWRFTRRDLHHLMLTLDTARSELAKAA